MTKDEKCAVAKNETGESFFFYFFYLLNSNHFCPCCKVLSDYMNDATVSTLQQKAVNGLILNVNVASCVHYW